MLSDFLRWKESNEPTTDNVAVEIQETSKAMVCPKTGRLMTKYKISKDIEHRLDLSPSINAVWIDKGEWELLKENGLATKLNNIFTNHWQHEIRSQESADIIKALYKEKFGENYAALKEFRERLNSMSARSEALAYLMADDPYKP